MKLKMDKLDIYNNSAIILEKKTPKKIISWITILIIVFVLFILFSFVPFNVYKSYIGYTSNEMNNFFFTSKLEYSDFPIVKNRKLYIKGKQYKYEVINIEDNNLILKINLEEDLRIDNNILTVNILIDRTTLFNIIKKKIKKGFGL